MFRAALGEAADPAAPEALAWLNDQERQAGIVLFVATPEAGAWSNAVLRQADQVVFVAQAVHFAPPSEIERMALTILPESQRRLVLVHPHKMQRAAGTGRWLDSRPVFLHHHVALTGDGFAIVSACVALAAAADGRIAGARVVLGGVADGPWRARATEAALAGWSPGRADAPRAAAAWVPAAHPLPGNRWKVDAAAGLLTRVLAQALDDLRDAQPEYRGDTAAGAGPQGPEHLTTTVNRE
jgi:xanthine dehydrogenase iron-sulfur cluster and FAD-binding subunit A